jgi:hypothetical protein
MGERADATCCMILFVRSTSTACSALEHMPMRTLCPHTRSKLTAHGNSSSRPKTGAGFVPLTAEAPKAAEEESEPVEVPEFQAANTDITLD